jgi:hypothetical protein
MNFNIEVYRGIDSQVAMTFVDNVTLLPTDLTGYSSVLNVKTNIAMPPVLSLSSQAGSMVLGGASGIIIAALPASLTATLDPGLAFFSLSLTSPAGKSSLLMKGFFTVIDSPFASTTSGSGGAPVTTSITIPWNQAYYMPNLGSTMGASDSYFANSNIDWSA